MDRLGTDPVAVLDGHRHNVNAEGLKQGIQRRALRGVCVPIRDNPRFHSIGRGHQAHGRFRDPPQ